jgi:hypothetical protein
MHLYSSYAIVKVIYQYIISSAKILCSRYHDKCKISSVGPRLTRPMQFDKNPKLVGPFPGPHSERKSFVHRADLLTNLKLLFDTIGEMEPRVSAGLLVINRFTAS